MWMWILLGVYFIIPPYLMYQSVNDYIDGEASCYRNKAYTNSYNVPVSDYKQTGIILSNGGASITPYYEKKGFGEQLGDAFTSRRTVTKSANSRYQCMQISECAECIANGHRSLWPGIIGFILWLPLFAQLFGLMSNKKEKDRFDSLIEKETSELFAKNKRITAIRELIEQGKWDALNYQTVIALKQYAESSSGIKVSSKDTKSVIIKKIKERVPTLIKQGKLKELNVKELKSFAKLKGIKLASKDTKAVIIEKIKKVK